MLARRTEEECRPLLLSGSAGLSRTQGSAGGGWSSCTHLINYGLNFNFGLAQFMASVFRPTSTLELGCSLGLYSDWMHRMAGAAPALGIEPVGVHSAALVRLVAAEYEPSLHGSGALAALARWRFSAFEVSGSAFGLGLARGRRHPPVAVLVEPAQLAHALLQRRALRLDGLAAHSLRPE